VETNIVEVEGKVTNIEQKLESDTPFTRNTEGDWLSDKSLFIFSGSVLIGSKNPDCAYGDASLSVDQGTYSGKGTNCPSGKGSVVFGYQNTVTGPRSTITGGGGNQLAGSYSSISGGYKNTVVRGETYSGTVYASISGGENNIAYASYSSILGGLNNIAGDPGIDDDYYSPGDYQHTMIPQEFNESRIAILEEDVVDVGGKVMNIEQNIIVTLEGNIEKVNENITKLQENVVKVETNIVEVEGKVTNIEQNVIVTLEGNIEVVKGNITKLEVNVVKVEKNMVEVEGKVMSMEQNIIATLEGHIEKVKGNITKLEENVVKVDTNIEILENNTPFTCKKKICKTPKNIIFLKEVKVKQKFCAKKLC